MLLFAFLQLYNIVDFVINASLAEMLVAIRMFCQFVFIHLNILAIEFILFQ